MCAAACAILFYSCATLVLEVGIRVFEPAACGGSVVPRQAKALLPPLQWGSAYGLPDLTALLLSGSNPSPSKLGLLLQQLGFLSVIQDAPTLRESKASCIQAPHSISKE